ncbi:MAG: alpha/beta fold hydrolase [Nitrososphaerales archaeon]
MSGTFLRVPSDGLELAVETFGEGPWLVFAHGLTGNRHVTGRQFAPLADRYRIVIYDQRGHGDSTPVTDPALYDQERMAGDMAAVMDALGIEKAIVGGESMGSATTLRFALRWPRRARALLLTAPAFSDSLNPATDNVANMGYEIRTYGMWGYLQRSAVRLQEQGASREVIATIAEMQSVHDPASLATACEACIRWVDLDMPQAAGLHIPACLIGWPDDALHPLDLAERLAEVLPDARLVTLPALSVLFAQPSEVGTIYGQFLAEHGM